MLVPMDASGVLCVLYAGGRNRALYAIKIIKIVIIIIIVVIVHPSRDWQVHLHGQRHG